MLGMIMLRLVGKGKILLSMLMVSVMYLHSSVLEEDILEHSNARCHMCIFLVNL
jgi:hypothetical protein